MASKSKKSVARKTKRKQPEKSKARPRQSQRKSAKRVAKKPAKQASKRTATPVVSPVAPAPPSVPAATESGSGPGRPTTYCAEIADKLCEQIESAQIGLRTICQQPGMPAVSTVFKWLKEHKEFTEQYARAREIQAELLADDIIELADKPLIGKKERTGTDKAGQPIGETTVGDCVERSKLMVEARKWVAVKLLPKKYGSTAVAPPPPGMNPQLQTLADALNAGPADSEPEEPEPVESDAVATPETGQ